MLKLEKVTFQNFMSFGKVPTSVDLDTGETTLIIGQNKDVGDEGTSKNGTGKTTTIQAVIYALYGKGIEKKMKSDDFVNYINEKKLEVRLDFSVNGERYYIVRKRKPNAVELTHVDENDKETSLTRDSMSNTDKFIEDLVGIPYEIFMGVFFMSPHQTSFMAMTTPEQRSFIESALSLDVLAERATRLKKIRTDIQTDIKLHQKDVDNANNTNSRVEQNIEKIEAKIEQWKVDTAAEIKEIEKFLEEAGDVDFQQQLEGFRKIRELEKKIKELPDLSEKYSLKKDLEREISDFSKDVTAYFKSVAKDSESKKSTKANLENIEKELEEAPSLDELEEELQSVKENSDGLVSAKNKLKELASELKSCDSDITRKERKIDDLRSELTSLESGECPYCKQSHTDEEKIAEVSEKIKSLEEDVKTSQSKKTDIEEEYKNASDSVNKYESKLSEMNSEREIENQINSVRVLISDVDRYRAQLKETSPYQSYIDEFEQEYSDLLDEHSGLSEENFLSVCVEETKKDIERIEHDISEVEEEKKEIGDRISSISESLDFEDEFELKEVMSEVEGAKSELAALHKKENPYTSELESMEAMRVDLDELLDTRDKLEKREKHCGYLIKLLTDPKSFVRKNIIDQYIPFLNKKINEYCEQIGLSHVITVNSDLTVEVRYMSRATSYYNMSQGERLRLNIATSLAFRDLLGMLGKNCNMMFFDELIDSAVDGSGGVKILKLVTSKSDNFWFISHREEFADYMERRMVVTKENGFTTLELK